MDNAKKVYGLCAIGSLSMTGQRHKISSKKLFSIRESAERFVEDFKEICFGDGSNIHDLCRKLPIQVHVVEYELEVVP